jgi:hypothetical protein
LISLRKKRKSANAFWMVGNSQGINVGSVNGTIVSVGINVEEGLTGSRESALFVTVKNEGDRKLKSLVLSMQAPAGIQIVNPGDLFGSAQRTHRTDALAPKQNLRFKLGLKAHPEFRSGTLIFNLLDNDLESSTKSSHFGVEVSLRTYPREL